MLFTVVLFFSTNTPSRSKTLSLRLSLSSYTELEKRAARLGQTPGGLAREMIVANLERLDTEPDLGAEIRTEILGLRQDLATATEALLTVIGGTKESGARAASWVSRNLNQ